MNNAVRLTRRTLLASAGAAGLVGAAGLAMPVYSRAAQRPIFTHGVQSGDVDANSGMIWTRTDRPRRVIFEVSIDRELRQCHAPCHRSTRCRRATLP